MRVLLAVDGAFVVTSPASRSRGVRTAPLGTISEESPSRPRIL